MKWLAKGIAIAITVTACAHVPVSRDHAADEAAIRAAMDRGVQGLVRHDWALYATYWANDPDVEIMHPAAREWVVGWDSVAAKYRAVLADTATKIAIENRRQQIHISASGDMAWVTQEDILRVGPEGKQTAFLQWSTSVYEKRGKEWRLVHGHASIPPKR